MSLIDYGCLYAFTATLKVSESEAPFWCTAAQAGRFDRLFFWSRQFYDLFFANLVPVGEPV
jgi:hypothetical protein